jgi:hypothetical protein
VNPGVATRPSYGISDAPKSVSLYLPGSNTGVLVGGRPHKELLPPPFNQVPQFRGHEIHHKFVVCGFRGDDPVVYCGSSNLALGGEHANGDNLLATRDADVATVFVIEALALVDHYEFLNTLSNKIGLNTGRCCATNRQTRRGQCRRLGAGYHERVDRKILRS